MTALISKPENCKFIVEDAEDDWDHDHPWDYIHGRALLTCFADPKSILQKAYDNLAPGGYLELQDTVLPWKFATPPPKNSPFARWNDISMEASVKGGRPWTNVQYYPRWFKEIGFEEIKTNLFFVPSGGWSNDPRDDRVGALSMLNTNIALEGWTLRNLERIGWTAEQTLQLVAEIKDELRSGKLQPYNELLVIYGRKPL